MSATGLTSIKHAVVRGVAILLLLVIPFSISGASNSNLDPQVRTKLGAVVDQRDDMSILGRGDVMSSLTSADLTDIVDHGGGYLSALAIAEARHRLDLTMHGSIRQSYQRTVWQPGEVHFDPHAISPGAAAFMASTEYLAAVEGSRFLPELLARPEVWAVPSWFGATFSAIGPGWVKPVIQRASELDSQRGATVLMNLVAGGATSANMGELRTVLQTEQSDAWMAAMQACARLNSGECWDLIAAGARRQGGREQVRTATVQFKAGRLPLAEAMLAAERAALELRQPSDPATRTSLAIELSGFLRFAQGRGLALPQPLREAIKGTGIAPLIRELSPPATE
jgi:hypothetical protein